MCMCVCAGSRGWRRMPWPSSPNKGWSPLCVHARGPPPFCPGGPPPTSEPVLSVCFLPWLAHLLSLSSSSSSSWSLLVSLALEGRGRCLLGGGRLLWAPASSLLDQPHALSMQAQRHISDLYEDLRDGHNLISLLEVLSGDSLVRVSARPSTTLPAFPPGVSLVTPPNSVSGLASAPPRLLVSVHPGLGAA